MQELRWNPLLGTYTMVAANRQNRPNMPKDWCPFCPGEGKKVPKNYSVFVYQNDFPALSVTPDSINEIDGLAYKNTPAYGACEVILYSPNHNSKLYELSDLHVKELITTWAERTLHFSKLPNIKYVFPFENRGEEVGVTMPHPHGQLYAYPFVPLKIKTELDNALDFYKSNALNLFDYIIDKELNIKKRVIFETKHFIVFLPYFTDYPYGIFIVAKSKYVYLHQLSEEEKQDLAIVLKSVVGTFDKLFDKSFPFMMCVHQGALNDPTYINQEDYYRLHIEFYPPLRNKDTIKYYASSEMGAWAAANTMLVEDCAKELREAYQKYLDVRN